MTCCRIRLHKNFDLTYDQYLQNRKYSISKMPLFKGGKHNKIKFEQKLHQAKLDPEPLFDISNCELSDIPNGVYSWCKVCRKEILHLHNNNIKTMAPGNMQELCFIRVLDLHNNKLKCLPDEIEYLSSLQELYLQVNELKKLPNSFGNLSKLEILNLEGNNFSVFPEPVTNLQILHFLNLSQNPLQHLLIAVINMKRLKTLVIDSSNFIYPPSNICCLGLDSVMKFLCEEKGVAYVPHEECDCNSPQPMASSSTSYTSETPSPQEASWQKYSQKKEQKLLEYIEVEKDMLNILTNMSDLHKKSQARHNKLVEEMNQKDEEMVQEYSKISTKQDNERRKLLIELTQLENSSQDFINCLLEINDRSNWNEAYAQMYANERMEFEKLFTNELCKNEELRKKEVLDAMQATLEQDLKLGMYLADLSEEQQYLAAQTADSEIKMLHQLEGALSLQDTHRANLVSELMEKEELQRDAFMVLLRKQDGEVCRLQDQISLIENELMNISFMEFKQQKLKMAEITDTLINNRAILTKLLCEIMEKKIERDKELKERLILMEKSYEYNEPNFWMRQYQRLLDNKSGSSFIKESNLEENVSIVLNRAKALLYIPFFVTKNITWLQLCQMSPTDLLNIGVSSKEKQDSIIREVKNLLEGKEVGDYETMAPSAPLLVKDDNRSVTIQNECVVCMENNCKILFLECGHICCCETCSNPLEICPLCRNNISQKIKLHFP